MRYKIYIVRREESEDGWHTHSEDVHVAWKLEGAILWAMDSKKDCLFIYEVVPDEPIETQKLVWHN